MRPRETRGSYSARASTVDPLVLEPAIPARSASIPEMVPIGPPRRWNGVEIAPWNGLSGRRRELLLRQAKPGEGGSHVDGTTLAETFYATQQVRVLPGQGWPPAGIECCVVRGRPRRRSVHRERAGCVMEPRKYLEGGVDAVSKAEDHITGPVVAWGRGVRRGRRAGHVRRGRPGTWEVSSSPPKGGGAGAAVEVVQALGESSCSGGANRGGAVVVPSEGDEARREGRRGVGVGG